MRENNEMNEKFTDQNRMIVKAYSKGKQSLIYSATDHMHRRAVDSKENIKHRKDLLKLLQEEKPKAVVIEGNNYGKMIPCERVLFDVLHSYDDMTSEISFTQRYAFLNKAVIFGGDATDLGSIDTRFPPKNLKRGELEALKNSKDQIMWWFLVMYNDTLSGGAMQDGQPMADRSPKGAQMATLKRINQMQNKKYTLDEIKNMYKEMVKGVSDGSFPENPDDIRTAMAPAHFLRANPESAKMITKINLFNERYETIRNQVLITAIEHASKHVGKTFAIYGASHYVEIHDTLDDYLGKPTEKK